MLASRRSAAPAPSDPRSLASRHLAGAFSSASHSAVFHAVQVTVEDITLNKLSCRFHTAAHPQSDCEAVGVLDLNSNEPRVDMSLRNLKVLQGAEGGWSCTGPPARLVAPPIGVVPPLPASCAAPLKSDDDDGGDIAAMIAEAEKLLLPAEDGPSAFPSLFPSGQRAAVASWMVTLNSSGLWPDVDYSNCTRGPHYGLCGKTSTALAADLLLKAEHGPPTRRVGR